MHSQLCILINGINVRLKYTDVIAQVSCRTLVYKTLAKSIPYIWTSDRPQSYGKRLYINIRDYHKSNAMQIHSKISYF